jgi:hypothetical protein
MAFVAGERYVFSFSDNSQSSGICINGARITSQNHEYIAPSTGNFAVGIYRNSVNWTWSSAVLTYRKATPVITSTTDRDRCGPGEVQLNAVPNFGTLNWYSAASGGSPLTSSVGGNGFLTPSINSTTTYYVEATANGCSSPTRSAVTATINPIPTITSTTPASRCGSGSVVLGATASAGAVNWMANPTGGGFTLGSGNTLTTPNISTTTTYYAFAQTSTCTSPTRTPVTATINGTPGFWNKIYETTNPSRDSLGSIVYVPGFGKTGGAASSYTSGFSRIKYRMENNVGGTLRWAEVSFDAWGGLNTTSLQIPDLINNATIQRNVFNIEVTSNMPGVNTGKFDTGRVEMWPYNYGGGVSGLIPAGNPSLYDWDDVVDVVTNGHGSFQIHNVTSGSRQTILAWNMHRNGGPAEIGFGDAPTGQPDWTGNTTNGSTNFKVQIFVGTPVFELVSGSQNQTLCSGTAIVNTVYSYSNGATGLSVVNLPSGLTSSLDTTNKRLTISGSPTIGGTY